MKLLKKICFILYEELLGCEISMNKYKCLNKAFQNQNEAKYTEVHIFEPPLCNAEINELN